jgi:transposase/ribosomal protein S19
MHRRQIRQAIGSALPPPRKIPIRENLIVTESMCLAIDAWLMLDQTAPKKQRHTGPRIFSRLIEEYQYKGSEGHLRKVIAKRKRKLNPITKTVFVPQVYAPGEEAEVDWYEAFVDFPQGRRKIYFFQMRACFSGKEFHMAFFRQTQQAFLEAHVKAFEYFGGVFKTIRYDNLSSAVKKVFRGRKRDECERFITLRSHYLFTAAFCLPGVEGAHEKGGVEGGVGRFRRNHLVPVPVMHGIDELNEYLIQACKKDDKRIIKGKFDRIEVSWETEKSTLLVLPKEQFSSTVVNKVFVNNKSLVCSHGSQYSVPVEWVGHTVEVSTGAQHVEIFHSGKMIARHLRAYEPQQMVADISHYLPLLIRKPGAFKKSAALMQARTKGLWPSIYDKFLQELKDRFGESKGTSQFISLLWWAKEHSDLLVEKAIEVAHLSGSISIESVQHIMRSLINPSQVYEAPLTGIDDLLIFNRPKLGTETYDVLLQTGAKA